MTFVIVTRGILEVKVLDDCTLILLPHLVELDLETVIEVLTTQVSFHILRAAAFCCAE